MDRSEIIQKKCFDFMGGFKMLILVNSRSLSLTYNLKIKWFYVNKSAKAEIIHVRRKGRRQARS